MNNKNENDSDKGASYPYSALDTCIHLAEAVKGLGGGGKTRVSKALLASSLKEDERSQVLTFKIGATKTFGLIEGKSEFVLTQIAKDYFFPTGEGQQHRALLEILEKPRAFSQLLQRFDGSKLPETEILANILHRECGVPESWKQRIAQYFIKSLKFSSAIDAQGFIRVQAVRDSKLANSNPTVQLENVNQSVPENPVSDAPVINHTTQIPPAGPAGPAPKRSSVASETFTLTRLDEQTGQHKTIYAEVPKGLTLALWGLLNSWVQSVKPEEKKQ